MAISIDIQRIVAASVKTVPGGKDSFDVVKIKTDNGAEATIFLPLGTGKSVADAINAAVSAEAVDA